MSTHSPLGGHLAMLTFSLLVSFSFSFGSLVAKEIEPAVLTAIRFVISVAFLGGVAMVLGQGLGLIFRGLWRWVAIGGLMAIYFVTMFEALRLTTAVSTAAVFTLTPLMAAGLGLLVNRQKTDQATLIAILIGGVGAVWVIFRADLARVLAFDVGWGEIIFFLGAICHAAVPAVTRKLRGAATPLQAAFGASLGALIVTAIYAAPAALATDFATLRPLVWWVAVYLGIMTTALTFFLIQFAIPRLSPGKVMAYTYLVPSWVVLYDLGGGTTQPPLLFIGIGLTLLALALLLRPERV